MDTNTMEHAPVEIAVGARGGNSTLDISPRRRFEADGRPTREKLYGQMTLIRHFEEKLLALFDDGELYGTTHAYIGQEANAVGILNHLESGDIVLSNHRCHGHFLSWSDRPDLLMAEIMGRVGGVVGGRGGSQHICHGNFYSNGIQGGMVPTATGMALAEKIQGTGRIVVVFLGDGTLGQGVVYESLNMASLWSVPVLFVVENNQWAQSTPVHMELAGDMVARGAAFGIDSDAIRTTDAEVIYARFEAIITKVRLQSRPHFEVIHTYRLCHHSKSDDQRPEEEVERHRRRDPLPLLRSRLDPCTADQLDQSAARRVELAVRWAREQPFPDPASLAEERPESATSVPQPPLAPSRVATCGAEARKAA